MTSESIGNDEYNLVFTAQIDAGWSIYSQFTEDGGPVPTSFNFDDGDHYEHQGIVAEKGKKKEGPDPLFDNVTVIKFTKGPVVFTQKVKVSDYSKPVVGWLEFMTCDDERCLPPTEIDFSFKLEPAAAAPQDTPENERAEAAPTTDQEAQMVDEAVAQTSGRSGQPITSAKAIEANTATETILQPVRWEVQVDEYGDKDYEITFTANLQEEWNLYSQDTEDNGPIPTAFYIQQGDEEVILPFLESGDLKEGMDPVFGVIVKKYDHGPVTFSNRSTGENPLKGVIEYMSCDATRCIPMNTDFAISFNPLTITVGDPDAVPTDGAAETSVQLTSGYGDEAFQTAIANTETLGECNDEVTVESGKGIWQIFGLGFLGGLIALLTPCVFPMIPLTVSFFTKSATTRKKGVSNALLYGFFIFLVYLLLSIPFHLMDTIDPDILNKISTSVPLNIFFFAIFIVFAISFFGYFELTVPESWTNKASSAEGSGGIIGIFFMALTLALVSFSCTGPILGSLLVGALSGDGGAMQLTAGMGGFGLALALPFAIFAAFPGMMKSLPRSGGWLNTVKVVLGFVELALALKFLSNADLVDHWGVLKIELFLGLWILIGIGLALYLFGKIKFPHDSPIKKLGPIRIGLAVLTVAFVAYLMTGFRVDAEKESYRPLTLLSGLAPPVCYSFWRPCDCPQQLDCFKDLEEGLAFAKENNKPVMIDFTGYACVNCRKMEENVWPEPEVYPYLKDDYVVISLYVDDKKELKEPMMVTTTSGRERELDEVGEKWAHFQQIYFNQNSQPQYVLVSPDGQRLNNPVNYTPDVEEYAEFLRCGLENFRRLSKQ
ncbi:protein-disulfide reductase DsbD family protein [Lewinella cohaerens]|uniref:protein-disulfide reductase DsbD family protein n=1 Tax=Lewinella cohaerens TaxID=70995 RepID=UPI0012EC5FCC|nr:thioredoxin family protein [Lewinella cohaerens]